MAYARKDIDWMEARQPYSGPRDQDHKRGYRERFHSPDRRGIRHHDRASVEKLSATGRRSSSVHSRHSRSRSQTSTHYASHSRLRSRSSSPRPRTRASHNMSAAQNISPQHPEGELAAATRETIQPVPSGSAQRQVHSPSRSTSELSHIGSATGVLGSDSDLQAVYREMALPDAVLPSSHKVMAVRQSDTSRTQPTATGDNPKLSVIAMKPTTTAAIDTKVSSSDSSDEPEAICLDKSAAHREQIKKLFNKYTQQEDGDATSLNTSTWNKTTLTRMFCKAPRQSIECYWMQLYPATTPDESTARQFINEIGTMRVTYQETFKAVCHTVRRMY